MDPDNSVSRIERTFWAVWYYITDAVNRFLRPEPTQTTSNDANSFQDSSVDGEHPISGNADVGISKEEDEEQPLASASLLSLSQPVVSWDVGTVDTDLGSEIENIQYKTQLSTSSEGKASEEGEPTREEQFNQTGSNDADLLLSRDEEEKEEDGQEGNTDLNQYVDGRDVMLKTDEQLKSGSTVMTDIVEDEGMEETGENTDDEQITGEVAEEVEEDHKDEEDFTDYCRSYKLETEETEVKLMYTEEDKLHMDDADTTRAHIEVENRDYMLPQASEPGPENQLSVCEQPSYDDTDYKGDPSMTLLDTVPHAELQMTDNNRGVVSDDVLTVVEPEQTMADRSEEFTKSIAEEYHKEKGAVDERERGAEEKENVNEVTEQTKDEESEQEEDNDTVRESSQQDDIITEGFTLNVKAEQHNTGDKNGEQEMTSENNDAVTKAIAVNEELFDINNDGEDKERLYREEENKEDYMDQPCTSTLDTFEQNGQEKCKANIPPGRREGQGVVSLELNSTTYKETQEGVPEYNNEPEPDGNTTQRFLEAGDYMEFQTSQLPEEVESNKPESLQNSNNSSGSDYSLVREHMEEQQQPEAKGTEVLRNVFVEENTGILSQTENENKTPLTEPAVHESGHLSEDKIGQLLDSSRKTGPEYFEKEFEIHFGSGNKTPKGHREKLLVELEINEGLCEADAETTGPVATGAAAVASDCTMKLLEDEVKKMTETSVDDSYKTYTVLQKDITEPGFLKNSAEAPEDSSVGIQDAGIDMEEDTCGDVKQTKEAENIKRKEIIKGQGVEVAAEITTEKENAFKTAFGLTEYTNTETRSDNVSDFSNNEMVMKSEVVQESIKTESQAKDTEDNFKHVTESEGGYTSDPISVRQDAIDEEILDLWIQTALSEDPDDLKQQDEAGPGPEGATDVDTISGGGDLKGSVQPEEKDVEVKLSESQPFSDPNASSSTAKLGFLDQSLDGWEMQNNNTHLLESSRSLPDSMLANVSGSADTFELSVKPPGVEDLLIEETADTGRSDLKEEVTIETGFHSDSVSRRLSRGSDELPEKTAGERVELMEAETGSHPQTESNQVKETGWKDVGEADIESLKKIRSAFEEELTKADDEPFETPGLSPDSPDEDVDTDSGRSSETETSDIVPVDTSSLNPGHLLLKLPSLDQPQLDWSDTDEPEPEPGSKTDDQPQPGDQVDAHVLDFTPQRSRIAVKNRRVRPPKDPRSLLHKPSVDPSPSPPLPAKVPVGVPLGGLGIGIKLPGLGAGLPVLKKTQKAVIEENHPDTSSQEPETKLEEKDDEDDTPKRDTSQHKPRWMPPGHTGFGNPLMSELKTKLKKTTNE